MSVKSDQRVFVAVAARFWPPRSRCARRSPRGSDRERQPAGDRSSGTNVPNALQGFQQNRGQPVQIEASRLEVRDKEKVATFTGNVKVVQGDTTMRCKTLVVFYEQKDEAQCAQPGQGRHAGGAAGSRRLVADQRVWRPRAASSSPRRTRPPPATPACST